MRKLRVAVVGAGRLGGFHAQKLAATDQVELTAVVDPDAEARNRVALECHSQPLADCRGLAPKIDAAVIAAPTRCHHALGMELFTDQYEMVLDL